MPEEKEHLKKVEKKIANMVKAIYEGEGDLNSAKLVGFFINKKGPLPRWKRATGS